jgi:hypothetical protein
LYCLTSSATQPNQKRRSTPKKDVDRHQKKRTSLSPMPKKLQTPDKFKFMTERSIRQEKFELTRWQSAQLRAKLSKGIFWIQLEKGGLIHWNVTLLQSYLLNGLESPITQALVEEYVSTLPQVA